MILRNTIANISEHVVESFVVFCCEGKIFEMACGIEMGARSGWVWKGALRDGREVEG